MPISRRLTTTTQTPDSTVVVMPQMSAGIPSGGGSGGAGPGLGGGTTVAHCRSVDADTGAESVSVSAHTDVGAHTRSDDAVGDANS